MNPRRLAVLCAVAAWLSASTLQLSGQETPRFQSSVELTSLDVTVVDGQGRPIEHLLPSDFAVRIDGQMRHVVSAEWVSLKAPEGRPPAPPPEGYSSNENATGGRLILMVIDQPNIPFAAGARMASAVGAFLDHLEPSDRVAAVALGQGGMATPFTADRELVKRAVSRMGGRSRRASAASLYSIGVSEAVDIARGSPMALGRVASRECEGMTPDDMGRCEGQISIAAESLANEAEIDGQQTVTSLRSLLEGLKAIEVPKTVILVSGGFIVREQATVAELGSIAAAARSSVYVVQVDEAPGDADVRSASPSTSIRDRSARAEGLEVLAAASRGSIFTVGAQIGPIFDRIEAELSGYYLIGVESAAADKDGRAHPIKVDVSRRGAQVRTRQQLVAAHDDKKGLSPREQMLAALASPLLVPALPMRVATFALQGPESAKIQVLIHADVGTDYPAAKSVALAYVIADSSGRIVDSHVSDARLPPVMNGVPSPLQFTGGASLDPGDYTLKLAVAEGDRVGTVEHPIHAGLVSRGALRLSELMVGGPAATTDLSRPTIGTRVSFGAVQGYIEVYGRGVARTGATFEIASSPDGAALLAEEVEPRPAGAERTIFSRALPVPQLPPGTYYLRAVVRDAGGASTTMTRSFDVGAPAVLMTAADSTTSPAIVPGDVYLPVSDELLARPFKRDHASREDTLKKFRSLVPPAGRASFDTGAAYLAQGDYANAEQSFKSVLDTDSESTAALAYLAATYAASGHDLEAAGAWQTSLIDGSNLPEIYEWLGGALLRSHQLSEAHAALEEAAGKWPADARFALPLALVYATFGQGREAVRSLERHLASQPDDAAAELMGVEWLYHLHAAGATAHTPREDLALGRTWADAYLRTEGPQAALVQQWMQALERDSR